VLKNVDFSMHGEEKKKNQKIQKTKQKKEKENRQNDKSVKNSFFFINQSIVLCSSHKEQHSTKDENK